MVYRRDVRDISGAWYGPIVYHDDQEMISVHNCEAEKNKWGSVLSGANDCQNYLHKEP
jgi:hypothetical protein